MVNIKNFISLAFSIAFLFSLTSCNVIKLITGGETKLGFGNGLEDGLFSFWRFEETSGNNAYPSPWGAVLSGMDSLVASAGPHGNSLDCSSQTENMYTTLGFAVSSNIDFTISFWVSAANNTTEERYLQFYEASPIEFVIGQNASGNLQVQGLTFSFNPGVGNWRHVTLIAYSGGGTLELYVDGSLYETINDSALSVSFESLSVCRDQNNSFPFTGQLDSLGIWERALEEDEIWNLYNGENHLD